MENKILSVNICRTNESIKLKIDPSKSTKTTFLICWAKKSQYELNLNIILKKQFPYWHPIKGNFSLYEFLKSIPTNHIFPKTHCLNNKVFVFRSSNKRWFIKIS